MKLGTRMFNYLLYQIEYRRWLFLSILLAIFIHLIPAPAGLSMAGKSTLGIMLMTVLLVIFEPVPLPVLAFLIVVLEVLFGVAPPAQVAQSFMSDSVVFIAGSLMLAVAIVKQNLDKRILFFILRISHTNVYSTVFAIIGLTALMASVMGEHAVAAIMLPVVLILVRLCRELGGELVHLRGVFLMSIAYASAVAAIGTPSGGARNAIMISYWENLAAIRVHYLDWMIFMYPLVLVQVPILYVVLVWIYRPAAGQMSEIYASLTRDFGQQEKLRSEDWITIYIVLFTLLLWIFFSRNLGLGPIALIGVLLCIILGVLDWEDISHDLNWGTIILYASIISLGLWMDNSGAADWLAGGMHFVLQLLDIHGGLPLIIMVSLVGMVTGSLLSTGPAIAILGPIVLKQAQLANFSPLILGMVMVSSTSYANFTPMSSPACTIIYGSELVSRREFLRIGFWMAVVSFLIIVLFAEFYWPLVLHLV